MVALFVFLGVGGATDTDDDYLFGGKADRLLNIKEAAFEGHGFESGFDTDDDKEDDSRNRTATHQNPPREIVTDGGKCRTITARKGDSPRYIDIKDDELKSFDTIGTKIVQMKDRQYTLSAHIKLTNVKFGMTRPVSK